jgi:hypothetical protein
MELYLIIDIIYLFEKINYKNLIKKKMLIYFKL